MKVFYLLLMILSLKLNAQLPPSEVDDFKNIKVKIKDTSLSCEYHSGSEVYICPNNDSHILVKKGSGTVTAIGRDENNRPQLLPVSEVESNGKVIYSFAPRFHEIEDFKSTKSFPDIISEARARVEPVKEFLKEIKSKFMFPSKNKDIIKGFIADAELDQEKLKKVYTESQYEIELEDGQKVSCKRGSSRKLTQQEQDYATQVGYPPQCGSFKCDPVTVDGQSYDATLLYDSNPYTMVPESIHLLGKDGLGPEVRVKKITAANASAPLVDNSSTLEYKKQYSKSLNTMMGKAIPASVGSEQDRRKIASYKDPVISVLLQYYDSMCVNDKSLKDLSEARKKLVEKLAYAELAEFIQVMGDGSLIGSFIDPSIAPEMGCYYNGVYLNAEAEKNLSRLKKNIHPDKQVEQTISMARAEQLFQKAADMKDIAWKYTKDGCYARAHLMARRFEEEGVRVDKVWIKGDLHVPDAKISWNFHVAPIVYVNDGAGNVKKMVIDPSLFKKPVTVEEWDAKMAKKTARGSVYTAFPFPENSAFMERSTLSFSSSDPYLPRDNISMSEEDKMNRAVEVMKIYKMQEPR